MRTKTKYQRSESCAEDVHTLESIKEQIANKIARFEVRHGINVLTTKLTEADEFELNRLRELKAEDALDEFDRMDLRDLELTAKAAELGLDHDCIVDRIRHAE